MKKLYLILFALLCCAALATPVCADVAISPLVNPISWIVIIIVLPIVVFVLYAILHDRKK